MKLETQWIVGFVDGEGCFHVSITNHLDMKLKYRPLPEFIVVQHIRDIQLLYALKSYFKCGVVRINHGDSWCYRVRGIEDLETKIIPFFEKHKLKTRKRLEFITFRKIVRAMVEKKHLTADGLEQIREWCVQLQKRQPKIESNYPRKRVDK